MDNLVVLKARFLKYGSLANQNHLDERAFVRIGDGD